MSDFPGALGDPSPALVARIAANLAVVRERIVATGRDLETVLVVAVTKGFGPEVVRAALACGLRHIGENYADELCDKADRLAAAGVPQPAWHFLGAIQGNKVGRLAGRVACFEGVDRFVEGERIARHAPGAAVLVEVDCTGRPGRGGVVPGEVPDLVDKLRALRLRVEGLMTVAPMGDEAVRREAFSLVARLAAQCGLAEVSMGMSDDYEDALRAGATRLRLGRALFGERPQAALTS